MKIFFNTNKNLIAFFLDILLVSISWVVAFYLRFNFDLPETHINNLIESFPFVVIIQGVVIYKLALYRGTWRYVSFLEVKKIILGVLLGSLILGSIFLIIRDYILIPRSVFIIYPLSLIVLMCGIRFSYRVAIDNPYFYKKSYDSSPVVVIGSGPAAVSLIKELILGKDWKVVSVLDDDSSMHGREIMGIMVDGNLSKLHDVNAKYKPSHIIVAIPNISHIELKKVIENANKINLKVLTIPTVSDLITGKAAISLIRPIKIDDLLGRDAVELDNDGLDSLISKNTILISGAGGSIGSELCRQVIKFKPKLLVCLDISEFSLYQLERELDSLGFMIPTFYLVGDVRDEGRITKIIKSYKPKVIFHAAAYKHVPLMEKQNVSEAIFNNVLGTYTIAKSAKQEKVEKFVLISTDKAVNPTNVMGASKRMAEMVCQYLQEEKDTRFIIVRFGNVLGSSGSVIPQFKDQISKGGPLTVTHPDMTRYFMSVQEASQLVMQAGLMGKGGEIFVLDMGDSIKIVDLARNMIRLSGFDEKDIEIKYTGIRPGEKLFEEVLLNFEKTVSTSHKKLRVASSVKPDINYNKDLMEWIKTLLNKEEDLIKKELKLWVKEYKNNSS